VSTSVLGMPIRNTVFMAMGEALDSFEAVLRAVDITSDKRCFVVAASLNASRDCLRSRLMPINRTYPLSHLRTTIADLPLRNRKRYIEVERCTPQTAGWPLQAP